MQDMSSIKEGGGFPFSIEDLVGWTIRRTDGTSARFSLAQSAREDVKSIQKESKVTEIYSPKADVKTSLSAYCSHTPNLQNPVFESDDKREGGPLRLFVGDSWGAKQTREYFDFVIDGGDVLSVKAMNSILEGDKELISLLNDFTVVESTTRLLKIDWIDRQAPDVIPEFWTALNKQVSGDVMTCCQGGHGRSGTGFVCLLLNNAPDYDALDAIVHLRAVHCPRAIESKVQHDYINDVAKFLGRKDNAHDVVGITDYKKTFRESAKPTAVRTRKMLGWDK